jgi:Protein of unknown function (DUF559)
MTHGTASPEQTQGQIVVGRLRRYAAGRGQGQPGFVVLAGPVTRSVALWQGWLGERGAGAIRTGHAGREAVIRAYLAGLLAGHAVLEDIAALLAPHVGFAAAELAGRLARQGLPERTALFRSLERAVDAGQLGLCLALLENRSGGTLAAEAATIPLVVALQPGAVLPGLLLVEPALGRDGAASEATGWLAEAAATALHLGDAVPGLLVGLAAEQPSVNAYLAGPASHVSARARAGVIAVPAQADAQAAPERTQWVRLGLVQEQVAPGVLAAFDETVRLLAEADSGEDPEIRERARSKAEQLLHDYLAGHSETAGLFELNGRMPFDFGNRAAEIDLVCRELGVAIEIDGYYHFRDPDGFRRDRRKDVLLQSHGFLVVRFLAGDIPARMSEIMTQILDVVRTRKQRPGHREQ